MVDFKTRIYHAEEDQIVGAEITVYSEEGDNIGSIQVTSKKDYDDLKAKLDNLDETYVPISRLEYEVGRININAQTLDGLSSTDFSLSGHGHYDEFPPKNHSSQDNVYGLANTNKYGHAKLIDNLNRNIYAEGEALSAKQGYELQRNITALRNDMSSWHYEDVGDYGHLWAHPILRLVYFTYYRENFTISKSSVLHKGYIPAPFRFSGLIKYVPSTQYDILGVNKEGNITLRTSRTSTKTETLRGWWIWKY